MTTLSFLLTTLLHTSQHTTRFRISTPPKELSIGRPEGKMDILSVVDELTREIVC